VPKSLHARLAEQAGRADVRINQLAVTLLAEGLGRKQSGLVADVERAPVTFSRPFRGVS